MDILLHEAGATYEEIEEFIVAGAFGTYLDIASTVRTGMFPACRWARFRQVGNAAGAGARQMLISAERRAFAAQRAPSRLRGTHGASGVRAQVHEGLALLTFLS